MWKRRWRRDRSSCSYNSSSDRNGNRILNLERWELLMYGMGYGGMSGACCPQPIAPVAGYGVGAGVGVGIIAIAILILIALGVIF